MPYSTYLRAVLEDYLRGDVSFGLVCHIWKRRFHPAYNAMLDAGLKGAECTPENVDKLFGILKKLEEADDYEIY